MVGIGTFPNLHATNTGNQNRKRMKEKQSYLENPYRVEGVENRAYITKENESIMIDHKTGDLLSVKKIAKNRMSLHDSKVYVKLFQENINLLLSLPTSSLRLLMYAACQIRPLSQVVILNPPDCMIVCGYSSRTTLTDAVQGLVDAKILAYKLGSTIEYWVNPNIFFNGNRLRII